MNSLPKHDPDVVTLQNAVNLTTALSIVMTDRKAAQADIAEIEDLTAKLKAMIAKRKTVFDRREIKHGAPAPRVDETNPVDWANIIQAAFRRQNISDQGTRHAEIFED